MWANPGTVVVILEFVAIAPGTLIVLPLEEVGGVQIIDAMEDPVSL